MSNNSSGFWAYCKRLGPYSLGLDLAASYIMRNRIQSLLEVLIVGVVGILLISACGRSETSAKFSINLSGNGTNNNQMCLQIYHPDRPGHCQQ